MVATNASFVVITIGLFFAYFLGMFFQNSANAYVTDLIHLILCIILMTLAEMMSIPATTAATGSLAPEDRIGRYMGLYGLVQGIGWSMGPFLGSQLFEAYAGRPVSLWAMLSFSALMAGIGFLWIGFNKLPQWRTSTPSPCMVEKKLPQRHRAKPLVNLHLCVF